MTVSLRTSGQSKAKSPYLLSTLTQQVNLPTDQLRLPVERQPQWRWLRSPFEALRRSEMWRPMSALPGQGRGGAVGPTFALDARGE
jgi:hypothetical protein